MRPLRTILTFTAGVAIALVWALLHRGVEVNALPANDFAIGEPLSTIFVDVDYDATPVDAVLKDLAGKAKLNLIIDTGALENSALDITTPIHLHLHHVPLSAVLDEVLHEYDGNTSLDYRLSQGILTVTTKNALEQTTVIRVYDVSDLVDQWAREFDGRQPETQLSGGQSAALPPGPPLSSREYAIDYLVKTIEDHVAPDTWRDTGGTFGSLTALNTRCLVVTQLPETHRQIALLLEKIRHPDAALTVSPADDVTADPLPALLVDVDYNGVAAPSALADLAAKAKLNLIIDNREFEKAGVNANATIHLQLHSAPFSAALDAVVHQMESAAPLGYRLSRGILTISTAQALQWPIVVRTYDVADLVKQQTALLDAKDAAQGEAPNSESKTQALNDITKTIEDHVDPPSWRGGGGSLSSSSHWGDHMLVVSTTLQNQQKIAQLLEQMRHPDAPPQLKH